MPARVFRLLLPALLSAGIADAGEAQLDAAGMPGLAQAQILLGTVALRMPAGQPDPAPALPHAAWTSAGGERLGEAAGWHARCADGSWLISGGWVVPAGSPLRIDAARAAPASWDRVLSGGAPSVAAPDAERFGGASPIIRAAWAAGTRVVAAAGMDLDDALVLAAALRRAGRDEWRDVATVGAFITARDAWQAGPWMREGMPLQIHDAAPAFIGWEERWHARHRVLDWQPERWQARATAMRLAQSLVLTPPAQRRERAAAIDALLDPADRGRSPVPAFAESLAIPPASAQAPLRERIAAWSGNADELAAGADDVPGLLGLLDDRGASRCWDGFRLRTVGDQALAALAVALGGDPRPWAGIDHTAAWTDQQRAAAAAALRAWAGARGPDELVADALPRLPAAAALELLARARPEERRRLVGILAAAWRERGLALADDPGLLARALDAVGGEPGFAATIAGWPVAGAGAPLLALWHDRHGAPGHLDAIARRLADRFDAAADAVALGIVAGNPAPGRIAALRRILAPGHPGREALLAILLAGPAPGAGALVRDLLGDRAELPAGAATLAGDRLRHGDAEIRLPARPAALGPGLRICDLAAAAACADPAAWGLPAQPPFPIDGPPAARDAAIAAMLAGADL